MNSANDLWKRHAQHWSFIGPPLRPSPQDIGFTSAAVEEWLRNTRRNDPTALVLGVTSELCSLPMGRSSRVIAVDQSPDMIRALWPAGMDARREVIRADWRRLPLQEATVDLVLADGSLSALPFPSGYLELWAELRRVLRSGGQCVVRCFTQTAKRETVEAVFEDLSRGLIGNFHALKLRLAMALQPDAEAGVVVGRVWETLHAAWPEFGLLAKRFGWPEAEVRTIEAYREVGMRNTFPTLAQYLHLLQAAGFSAVKVLTPTYELGERCPTLALERP
jgi:SAM-dependent methyltransferase